MSLKIYLWSAAQKFVEFRVKVSTTCYGSKVDIECIPLGTLSLRDVCPDFAYFVVNWGAW